MDPLRSSAQFSPPYRRITSEMLQTEDLPVSPALRKRHWSGVFGAHIARAFIAVNHGGMREDWNPGALLLLRIVGTVPVPGAVVSRG